MIRRARSLIIVAVVLAAAIAYVATRDNHPEAVVTNPYELAVSTDGADVAARERIDAEATKLLAGIPQHGVALGQPTAPITLQVYGDLQCLSVKQWFTTMLPGIINEFVRANVLRLEYHSLETDTLNSKEFIMEQTAALAASRQGKMWNFLETFYYEQGREYTKYLDDAFLIAIAKQIGGLNLEDWSDDINRKTAATVAKDDRFARSVRLYDTPGFRIGRTGERLTNFMGFTVIRPHKIIVRRTPTGERIVIGNSSKLMHPLSLVTAFDVRQRIKELI